MNYYDKISDVEIQLLKTNTTRLLVIVLKFINFTHDKICAKF